MLAIGLSVFVALQHIAFMIIEMFLWDRPLGLKVFRQSLEKARMTKALAVNQGIYNGFLAAGLVWGVLHPDSVFAGQIRLFFLVCVVVAGVVGALTVSKRILWIQSMPAALAALFMFLG